MQISDCKVITAAPTVLTDGVFAVAAREENAA